MRAEKLLEELGVEVSDNAIKKVTNYTKDEIDFLKTKEVYRRLLDEYGNTMTREQVMYELGITKSRLTWLIQDGTAPDFWRTSDGKKATYKFLTISVSEFLS